MSSSPPSVIALAASIALAFAAPAMAEDGTGAATGPSETKTEEAGTAGTATAGQQTVPAMPFALPGYPSTVKRDGGTAIVNFVAPVTAKTMAELAKTVQNAAIGGAEAIRINISSRGGSVHAIQFAVNVLDSLPVKIETVAMSQIASAAVALYCAGDERYMAKGSGLYLHQQRGFEEIQDKTAAAVMREYELDKEWYDGLLASCADEDADRTVLDYSARDVVIDVDQATALGMATAPMPELDPKKTWGLAVNVIAPESPHGMGGYPFMPYR